MCYVINKFTLTKAQKNKILSFMNNTISCDESETIYL